MMATRIGAALPQTVITWLFSNAILGDITQTGIQTVTNF